MPTHCPACGTRAVRLEGEVALRCPNRSSCPAQIKEEIRHFASREGMDIRGLGDKLVDQLVESGAVRSLADLYELTEETLASFERMGEKSARNLMNELHRSKERPFPHFLAALGIRFVGVRGAELLARAFPDIVTLGAASEDALASVDGVGPVVASAVRSFFEQPENRKMLERLAEAGVQGALARTEEVDENSSRRPQPLEGLRIVFTGELKSMTRSEAEERAKRLGARCTSNVSGATSLVVAGDNAGSKLAKARSLGVRVAGEAEFLEMIRDAEDA